jgi:penicillin-binding protein 2
MFRFIKRYRNSRYKVYDIDPDEVFLDSANLMNFDTDQFEGRIEKPISKSTLTLLFFSFGIILIGLLYKVFILQIVNGEDNYYLSENNRLKENVIFATRGNVYDRNAKPLIWNEPQAEGADFAKRVYTDYQGLSGLLGFITYPKKDSKGFYYELNYSGKEGIEKQFEYIIGGKNGSRIIETNALGDTVSENLVHYPNPGDPLTLSIDVRIQEKLYESIKEIAEQVPFQGGGGVIMDIHTGEIIALASYPTYDSQKLADGDSEYIKQINQDTRKPFLNRITQGLYTPGSIVKPYVAVGALNEGVVDQYTNIVSLGKLEVPNPYDPSNPTFFSDWKAHGSVDVRRALAVSSNIYFYVVGGGYKDIEGLGITKLESYFRKFGFGSPVNGQISSSIAGTIPNPDWKAKNFDGDIWRLGDTYFTSIGQYGFQATPLQAVRAVAAIANKGTVYDPLIVKDTSPQVAQKIEGIKPEIWKIVQEGMRQGVLEGTAKGLNMDAVQIAAKTGTAELGVTKDNVNSWTTGFFPYNNPRYAFVVVMEKGSRHNVIGGVAVSRKLFDWMAIYTPEYFE